MKKWRTLIRIISIDHDTNCAWVVVPAWNSQLRILVDRIPADIASQLDAGMRVHAKVYLNAEKANQLEPTDWEVD